MHRVFPEPPRQPLVTDMPCPACGGQGGTSVEKVDHERSNRLTNDDYNGVMRAGPIYIRDVWETCPDCKGSKLYNPGKAREELKTLPQKIEELTAKLLKLTAYVETLPPEVKPKETFTPGVSNYSRYGALPGDQRSEFYDSPNYGPWSNSYQRW